MLKRYRAVTLSSRLLIYGALVLLSFAIAVSQHNSWLNVGLITLAAAGIGLAFDVAVRQTRLVFAVGVGLAQLLFAYLISLQLLVQNATLNGAITGQSYLFAYTSGLAFFLALLVHAWLALRFMRGRVWINLLVLSVIMDAAFFAYSILLQDAGISLPVPLALALATSGVYAALRIIRRRKAAPANFEISANRLHSAESYLRSMGMNASEIDSSQTLRLVATPHDAQGFIYAVMPLPSKQDVSHTREGFFVDGEEHTDYLERFLREVHNWRRAHKLPASRVVPVIWNTRPSPRFARRLKVYLRKRPDMMLGQVYLVNNDGFRWLTAKSDTVRKPSKRMLKKLDRALAA